MEKKIQQKREKVAKLLNEIIDLQYEQQLKSAIRFEERIINFGRKKNPKEKKCRVMFYNEVFIDEDTKKKIKVERQQIVEIDGQKSFDWNIIEYYKPQDIGV